MTILGWLGRLRTFVFRRGRLRDHDEEVEFHLSLLATDLQRQGWTRDAAEQEARRRFGGRDQVRERYRDASGFPSVDALGQDLHYSMRMLRRQPAFSLLVVLLVATGVGANTATFSLVDAILLRPLPYPAAGTGSPSFARWCRSRPISIRASPPRPAISSSGDRGSPDSNRSRRSRRSSERSPGRDSLFR